MSRILLLLAALALALPASAAETPEAVYAKYHRAAVKGDIQEMMRHTTEEQRAEMEALTPDQRAASMKMIEDIMPPTYTVRAKSVYPGGTIARIYLSGPARNTLDGKPGKLTLYGVIRLVVQHGEWKVQNVGWSNEDPGLPDDARKGAAKK